MGKRVGAGKGKEDISVKDQGSGIGLDVGGSDPYTGDSWDLVLFVPGLWKRLVC